MDLYIQLQPKLQAHADCGRPEPDQDKVAGQARQEVNSLRAERTSYESQLHKANEKVTSLAQVVIGPQLHIRSFTVSWPSDTSNVLLAGGAAATHTPTQEQQHECPPAHEVRAAAAAAGNGPSSVTMSAESHTTCPAGAWTLPRSTARRTVIR